MKATRVLNGLLLLIFVALIGAHWVMRQDPTKPNAEFIPEMVRTPRYNAFAPNPNFPDGKTLQRPERGAIPRGYPPLHYTASPADALRAGEELRNSYSAADAQAVQRGASVYNNFCQECHGPSGRGDGPVALRGFPAPPSLLADRAIKMNDGQIFHILTYGQNNMPSYAAQLTREDRWKVILFVRSLQRPAAALAAGGQP